MKKPFLLLAIICLNFFYSHSQETDPIENARQAFRAQDYPLALEWLKKAEDRNPDNAMIYYYQGYFSHYMVHHSRPFEKKSFEWSHEHIIKNLEHSLELNPELNDARYVLGVEHIYRAWDYLITGNGKKFREEYQQAFDKGGLPAWLLEEGRNHLMICPENSILFINGDLHLIAISWLQIMEGFRRDVSVISLDLLNRPWFLRAYRDGIQGVVRKVPLSWSELQIAELHNFSWRPKQLNIPVPEHIIKQYGLEKAEDTMRWIIEPDLISTSRITYLSPGLAAFVDIIEQNKWQRPVFTTMGPVTSLPLEKFRRQYGPLIQILPFDTKEHELDLDIEKTRDFYFDDENFKNFPSLKEHNFPRVSGILFNHHMVLLNLTRYYYDKQQWELAMESLERIEEIFPDNILPVPEDFRGFINELREEITEKRK